jgi:glycerophosphoryl diester phosphodiesterase
LPAFRLAFDEGAEFIEGDFWLTRDGQIVCLHDEDTRRVASQQPVRRVKESTLAELRELDVGAWKAAKYAGTRIPTLEEVLAVVPKDRGIYIEIKDDRPEIAKHLKRVLDKSPLNPRQVAVIAFDPAIIEAVKAELPHLKAFWLYWWYWDKKTGKLSNTADEILRVARAIRADGIDVNRCRWADAQFIRQARSAGLEVHVYTVNDLVDAVRYVALGADSITTDRPRDLRSEIERYFRPLESTSDVDEVLTVNPDGTWKFTPHRPKK